MKHLSNNDFNDNLLTNVPDGTNPQDAVNKRQLDDKVDGTIRVTTAATAPANPNEGDLWLDTTDTDYPLASYLQKSLNLSDLGSSMIARANLGITDGAYANASAMEVLANPYSFEARLSADVTAVTGAWNIIIWNSKNFDDNNNLNTSTGEYIVPKSGKYSLNWSVQTNGSPNVMGSLWVNDVLVNRASWDSATGSNRSSVGVVTKKLVAGDVITIRAYVTGTGTQLGIRGGEYTYFSGHYIGA